MAVSTPTVAEVRAIITSSLSDDAITAYIADAVLLVEGCVSSLSETLQKSIVKYTTAHLIALNGQGGTEAMLTSKKLGDASETYARPGKSDGEGLASTTFGQTAISLDPNGCLAMVGNTTSKIFMQVL